MGLAAGAVLGMSAVGFMVEVLQAMLPPLQDPSAVGLTDMGAGAGGVQDYDPRLLMYQQ